MRKITLLFGLLIQVALIFAQTPHAFKYQAVARNNSGEIIANQNISFRMSVLQGALPGTVVYSENHAATTNDMGLVTLEIGRGTPFSGDFGAIDWSITPCFLKTEIDTDGGSAFIEMGTSELLSVPYSWYAENTANNDDADANPANELQTLSIDGNNLSISNGNTVTVPGTGSNAWYTGGNSGTIAGINFIGTTDEQDFDIGTNNVVRTRISMKGQLETLNTGHSVFVGEEAGENDDSSDNYNTFIGYRAGYTNTTGEYNTAYGVNALILNSEGNNNSAMGGDALFSNTTGVLNTASGASALFANSTGNYNTASGADALYLNTEGNNNTATGVGALNSNTTGHNNTAGGLYALYSNTEGNSNTGFGSYTDVSQVNLSNATAIGYGAIANESNQVRLGNNAVTSLFCQGAYASTTENPANLYVDTNGQILRSTAAPSGQGWSLNGNAGTVSGTNFIGTTDAQDFDIRTNNIVRTRISQKGQIEPLNTAYSVFVGEQAGENDDLSDNHNTFTGYRAGYSNTSGGYNTTNGSQTLYNNINGIQNTASGYTALYSNATGNYNIATGSSSLYYNTSGDRNVAVGYRALYTNTTGYNNTANGYLALLGNITGNENTAIGCFSLRSNTTGHNNMAIGGFSLFYNVSGNCNTGLGYNADVSTDNLSNATAIGYNASVNASDKVRIGNAGVSVIEGPVAWSIPSDKRFGYNIQNNVPGLVFINSLKPVSYQLNAQKYDRHVTANMPDSIQNQRIKNMDYSKSGSVIHTGFFAQDVEKICRELNYDFDGLHIPETDNNTDHYSLAYSQFVVPLVKAVQEQQAMINKQQMLIEAQNDSLVQQQKTIGELIKQNAEIIKRLENQ